MIRYDSRPGFISPLIHLFSMNGSVIPKATCWAVVSAGAAVFVNTMYYDEEKAEGMIASVWLSYSFLLSFLIVFRTQSAYSRYWEGASTLNAIKGDFVNAASCIFAFCSRDPAKSAEVRRFQHLVARLLSLLHCSGLQSIAHMDDEGFQIFDLNGIDEESIAHLNEHKGGDSSLVVLQWIQKAVVASIDSGVLQVAPPIASRVFQQLGQGVIQLSAAQKISDVPFPFPYTQMVTLLLCGSTVVTPIITGLMISQARWAATLTFVGIFGFWAINYIAAEIEMPFGDDKNDLPMSDVQIEFNNSLKVLFKPTTQTVPGFVLPNPTAEDADDLKTCKCSVGLDIDESRRASRAHEVAIAAKAGALDAANSAVHGASLAAHHLSDIIVDIEGHCANGNFHHDHGHAHAGLTPETTPKKLVCHVEDVYDPYANTSYSGAGEAPQLVALAMRVEKLVQEVSKNVGAMTKSTANLCTVLDTMACTQSNEKMSSPSMSLQEKKHIEKLSSPMSMQPVASSPKSNGRMAL